MTPVQIAAAAQQKWQKSAFAQRAQPVLQSAQLLRLKKNEYVNLMAREMGKPVTQGAAEIEKCALACEYYAGNAEQFLADETVTTDASRSFVTYRPLGVVLAIMPWNFPFWQVFRCAAPTLMAGNVMILKHASNVPGCAMAIENLFKEAGLPAGVFQTLLINSQQAEALIEDPGIAAVTLTGSVEAGRAVAARAGKALKKTVLELGGSDPYIILEDADLNEAVPACVNARLVNAGQSCIAGKRFIVVESVKKQFEEKFVAAMKSQTMGDPLDPATTIGPLAREDVRQDIHRQVRQSIERGARLLLGGKIPEGPGWFYPPTVLTDVRKGMAVYDEETFGPVAAIIPVKDEAEAVAVANDTNFGLGAAVFTADKARGECIAAAQIHAGSCFVNAFVRSDPRLPFGGIKDSGYGRELGLFGIREFVNAKTVYVK